MVQEKKIWNVLPIWLYIDKWFYLHTYTGARNVLTPGTWLAGFMPGTTLNCYMLHSYAQDLLIPEKKMFYVFQLERSILINDSCGVVTLDPRVMFGRIFVAYHITLLHMNTLALDLPVSKQKIFEGSSYLDMNINKWQHPTFPLTPPSPEVGGGEVRGPFWPKEHDLQDLCNKSLDHLPYTKYLYAQHFGFREVGLFYVLKRFYVL